MSYHVMHGVRTSTVSSLYTLISGMQVKIGSVSLTQTRLLTFGFGSLMLLC